MKNKKEKVYKTYPPEEDTSIPVIEDVTSPSVEDLLEDVLHFIDQGKYVRARENINIVLGLLK